MRLITADRTQLMTETALIVLLGARLGTVWSCVAVNRLGLAVTRPTRRPGNWSIDVRLKFVQHQKVRRAPYVWQRS
jgi:hypothetical protein